jgi:DNA-binding CsgD family transcriptional regulator
MIGSRDIHILQLRGAVSAAKKAGIPIPPLFEGVGVDEHVLETERWLPWNTFSVLAERIETEFQKLGLADDFGLLIHREMPFIGAVVGTLVSPPLLYRALHEMGMFLCRNVVSRFEVSKEGFEMRIVLRPTDRPGDAFFRQSTSFLRYAPLQIGLGPASVEGEIEPRQALYRIRPPAVVPLAQRLSRGVAGITSFLSEQLRLLNEEGLSLNYGTIEPTGRAEWPDADSRIAAMRARFGLTERQTGVLSEVIRGRSNKEVATALGCSERTVEVHVGLLMKKSGFTSRAELIARFWSQPL